MNNTKIEWCDKTLNPVVGCTYGCPYCYSRRINDRFRYIPDFFKPQFFPERLKQLKSKKPAKVFLTSMSDPADWKPVHKRRGRKILKVGGIMKITKDSCIYRGITYPTVHDALVANWPKKDGSK